jgi:hypothetical protein
MPQQFVVHNSLKLPSLYAPNPILFYEISRANTKREKLNEYAHIPGICRSVAAADIRTDC